MDRFFAGNLEKPWAFFRTNQLEKKQNVNFSEIINLVRNSFTHHTCSFPTWMPWQNPPLLSRHESSRHIWVQTWKLQIHCTGWYIGIPRRDDNSAPRIITYPLVWTNKHVKERDEDFLLHSDSLAEMEKFMFPFCTTDWPGSMMIMYPKSVQPKWNYPGILQATEPLPTLMLSSSSWENSIGATDSTCLQCTGLCDQKKENVLTYEFLVPWRNTSTCIGSSCPADAFCEFLWNREFLRTKDSLALSWWEEKKLDAARWNLASSLTDSLAKQKGKAFLKPPIFPYTCLLTQVHQSSQAFAGASSGRSRASPCFPAQVCCPTRVSLDCNNANHHLDSPSAAIDGCGTSWDSLEPESKLEASCDQLTHVAAEPYWYVNWWSFLDCKWELVKYQDVTAFLQSYVISSVPTPQKQLAVSAPTLFLWTRVQSVCMTDLSRAAAHQKKPSIEA